MKAEELDKIFDEGKEDILPYLDMTTLRRPKSASTSICRSG